MALKNYTTSISVEKTQLLAQVRVYIIDFWKMDI